MFERVKATAQLENDSAYALLPVASASFGSPDTYG